MFVAANPDMSRGLAVIKATEILKKKKEEEEERRRKEEEEERAKRRREEEMERERKRKEEEDARCDSAFSVLDLRAPSSSHLNRGHTDSTATVCCWPSLNLGFGITARYRKEGASNAG